MTKSTSSRLVVGVNSKPYTREGNDVCVSHGHTQYLWHLKHNPFISHYFTAWRGRAWLVQLYMVQWSTQALRLSVVVARWDGTQLEQWKGPCPHTPTHGWKHNLKQSSKHRRQKTTRSHKPTKCLKNILSVTAAEIENVLVMDLFESKVPTEHAGFSFMALWLLRPTLSQWTQKMRRRRKHIIIYTVSTDTNKQ